MIEIEYQPAQHLLTIRAAGTLTDEEYRKALREIEQAIETKKESLNAVVIADRLEEWDLPALWKELGFDVEHHDEFGRIAVVGSSRLLDESKDRAALVTSAEVKFFAVDDMDRARKWAADHPRPGTAT